MKQKILILSFSIFFILNCSQQTLKQEDNSYIPPDNQQSMLDGNLLLEKAENASANQKNKLFIQAAYVFIKNNAFNQAEEILARVETKELNNELDAFFYSQKAEILISQQLPKQAIDLIESKVNINKIDIKGQILITEIKSKALFQNSQYIESINELIFISPLLDPQHKKYNNELIWKTLTLLSLENISQALKTTNDPNLLAWLELANINKAYQHDIELQSQKLDEWIIKNKDHDANDALPETLKQIKIALKNRPKKIAVFLPESGPLAKSSDAIKRGFLNNYYRALEKGSFTPEINFYDTSDENLEKVYLSSLTKRLNDSSDKPVVDDEKFINKKEQGFLISYQNAIDSGADLIIGPLSKNYIDLLQKEKNINTPTLTLNYGSSLNAPTKNNIFQFGLAPEDEIEFIAKQARLKTYQNVAILAPNSDWGNRLSESFKEVWEKKGGSVVSQKSYESTKELTKIIEQMLNIDQSEQRFKRLYWYSEGKAHFNARRREDIDFIYLVSTPEMGRQIAPTFTFHNASDIPVYANSTIYSGEYNISDKDLNGIMFTDLPAIININDFKNVWHNQDPRYKRLIAMGMDTYDLSVRLNILKISQQNKMYGQTGILDISENLRINREPTLAKFFGSNTKAIPILFEK